VDYDFLGVVDVEEVASGITFQVQLPTFQVSNYDFLLYDLSLALMENALAWRRIVISFV